MVQPQLETGNASYDRKIENTLFSDLERTSRDDLGMSQM